MNGPYLDSGSKQTKKIYKMTGKYKNCNTNTKSTMMI